MPISGMNHAVLYVRDAQQHRDFYASVLDFSTIIDDEQGRFVFMRAPLSTNHHDIAFFTIGSEAGPSRAGAETVGMYHVAWEVPTMADLQAMEKRLSEAGVLVGASDHGANKSLYAKDPDGLEFEVMFLVPAAAWGDEEHIAIVRPLDIAMEANRFA